MMIASPFRNPHVRMQPHFNAATSAHLSATALLQKAATVGATAITGPIASVGVGQHQQHVTQLGVDEFGRAVTQLDSVVPDHHHYMNSMGGFSNNTRSLKSSDDLTRDFLGLTGDGSGGGSSGGGNGGAVEVSMNVKDMLTFTGSVDYHQHQHSLFKSQQGFGFLGTTTAPESWGNC